LVTKSAFLPLQGGKFRFRAGLAAWQSRNAGPISTVSPRAEAANHGIVTDIQWPVD
jgi:hypothetical protein